MLKINQDLDLVTSFFNQLRAITQEINKMFYNTF